MATILGTIGLAVEAAPEAASAANTPSWYIWAIGIGVVGLLVLALAVLAKYLRLAVNLFLDTPLPLTANLKVFTPPEGEIVTFPSLEGRSLQGMFIDRPREGAAGAAGATGTAGRAAPSRGTILFCHEFASDMMSAGRYAWPLVEAGYTVFTFDFRGHGRSFTPPHFEPRYWPSNYEVNDILAAIAYVTSHSDVDERGIGVLGVSRGAGAAVVAAALNPRIRCLALDGVFSTDLSIDELMKRWAQIFARVDFARVDRTMSLYRFFRTLVMFYVELKCRCRFPSVRRALTKLQAVPILFIQGQRDTYVRPELTEALYNLKPGPKEFWLCPEAKHNQAVAADPKTYAQKIVAFFDRHLGSEAAPAAEAAAAPSAPLPPAEAR